MENQEFREIDMNDLFPAQKKIASPKKKGRFVRSNGMKGFLSVLSTLCFTAGASLLLFCDMDILKFRLETVLGASSLLIFWFLCLAGMLAVSGKKPGEEKIHLMAIDRIWIEVLLIAGFIVVSIGLVTISDASYWVSRISKGAVVAVTVFFCWILLYTILLSVVRQLKAVNKNFACYRFSKQIIRFFKGGYRRIRKLVKELFDGKPFASEPYQKRVFYSQMTFVVGLFILFALLLLGSFANLYFSPGLAFLAVLCFAGFIALSGWYVAHNNEVNRDIGRLVEQIHQIKDGNLNYDSEISPQSPLYEASRSLNGISEGFQKSVEQQIKSERMKIELVTNVSHDLKTPLTSIISYINLLQKEEELSPEARDYVNILSQKSDRLKNIVEDLFSLAKVTSGNMEVEREELDMTRLVIQTLADMGDRIENSGHIVKTNITDRPAPIFADGKRLYRVLQNVIDNALKYSLLGTRIFVDLKVDTSQAVLTVKNTASYEMDFTEEEIMERFSRGDKSRTTEGSGLGLSIAEGFTEACGGDFGIEIDGDQFKVKVSFPLCPPSRKEDSSAGLDLVPSQENQGWKTLDSGRTE